MMEITAPCPFCGTPARIEDDERFPSSRVLYDENPRVMNLVYAVRCLMCGAQGPASETEQEAVYEWNNRKE